MKKLLYLAAFVAALTFTACNKGTASLPDELRQQVEQADKEIKSTFDQAKASGEFAEMEQYGLEMDYEGVEIDDHTILFKLKLGGELMNMISFSALAENMGFSQEEFEKAVRRGEIFEGTDMDDREMMRLMREYKYNIGIQIRGNMKEDVIQYTVSYEDLPEDIDFDAYDFDDFDFEDLDEDDLEELVY